MSQTADYEDEAQQDGDGFEEASKCFACGTLLAAVDEETHRMMMARHVLDEHSDQAHPDLLDECREVLADE